MSNAIRYDSLLVRHLADELRKRLVGRFCADAPLFDADRNAILELDGGEALELALHPLKGWVRIRPAESATGGPGAECVEVESPPDERYFSILLRMSDRFQVELRRIFVELHTNQWNVLVVEGEENRIVSALRARRAGKRILEPGAIYEAPAQARPREGSEDIGYEAAQEVWLRTLAPVPPAERRSVALARIAYLGSINVDSLLGDAAVESGETLLLEAFDRWWSMVIAPAGQAVVLDTPAGPQPYPVALPGLPSREMPSLLAAMQAVADDEGVTEVSTAEPAKLRPVRREIESANRRVENLRAELATADDPDVARGFGDLLLAHLHLVPRGGDSVKLAGWDGNEVTITLEPTLTPAENADRWYSMARRSARARERVPGLIREAEAEEERWKEAAEALERGEEPPWLTAALSRTTSTAATGGDEEQMLPYRNYTTSGGLEARVGRNSKANDRLTFHSSKPDDIWLHARSVAGSHVILRWSEVDAPPARDLAEAAGLAALFSKARTSAVVAVDWTRRKHVRKPRGAPPGAVIPQRVKTVFVEPDPALEERLRSR